MSRFFVPALDAKPRAAAGKGWSVSSLSDLPFTLVQWRGGSWVDVCHGRSRAQIEARAEALRLASPDVPWRILTHDGSNRGFLDAVAALPLLGRTEVSRG